MRKINIKRFFVYHEKLSFWKDPEEIFDSLYRKKKQVFWLDSSIIKKGLSRFSYMGEAETSSLYYLNTGKKDIFSYLHEQLQNIAVQKTKLPFDFVGGFIGYFGYELKALCGYANEHTSAYPDSLWFFVDKFIAFDHESKTIYLVCLTKDLAHAKSWVQGMKSKLRSTKKAPKVRKEETKNLLFHLNRNKKNYINDSKACKALLKDGESYEICLTNTITAESSCHPFELYRSLRKTNPAPYAAYIKYRDLAILCSSPERFLKIDQLGTIESKPIKGTSKRSANPDEDQELANSLQKSLKDRAENLMIVDLVRNDIGRVAKIGSITVSKLMEIETYQTVHHLVSTIQGKLKKDASVIDCITSCFPGGSMTGAPKKRTIELIDKLEKRSRGIYSGALGFLSANGAVDLNIVIRTLVVQNDQISMGVGGAIVMLSDPKKEYEEMILKAQALMKAITTATGNPSYTLDENIVG